MKGLCPSCETFHKSNEACHFPWEDSFDISEDESGKFHYPVWWVFDSGTTNEVAGPFDTEDAAVEAAIDLMKGERL